MPAPRPSTAWRTLALPILIGLSAGCATLSSIESDGPLSLAPDQGVVVIHIDSNVPVKRLLIGQTSFENLPAGRSVKLAVARSGTYRWRVVEFEGHFGGSHARTRRYIMSAMDYWEFRVKSGHLNYPGQLVIRGEPDHPYFGRIYGYNVNRSALAYEQLTEEYPIILESLPITYGGRVRDPFLDRLSTLRSERARAGSAERPES